MVFAATLRSLSGEQQRLVVAESEGAALALLRSRFPNLDPVRLKRLLADVIP